VSGGEKMALSVRGKKESKRREKPQKEKEGPLYWGGAHRPLVKRGKKGKSPKTRKGEKGKGLT